MTFTPGYISFCHAITAAAGAWGISEEELFEGGRYARVVEARQMAYLLCYESLRSGTVVARLFHKNPQSIYSGMKRIMGLCATDVKTRVRCTKARAYYGKMRRAYA